MAGSIVRSFVVSLSLPSVVILIQNFKVALWRKGEKAKGVELLAHALETRLPPLQGQLFSRATDALRFRAKLCEVITRSNFSKLSSRNYPFFT